CGMRRRPCGSERSARSAAALLTDRIAQRLEPRLSFAFLEGARRRIARRCEWASGPAIARRLQRLALRFQYLQQRVQLFLGLVVRHGVLGIQVREHAAHFLLLFRGKIEGNRFLGYGVELDDQLRKLRLGARREALAAAFASSLAAAFSSPLAAAFASTLAHASFATASCRWVAGVGFRLGRRFLQPQ